MAAGTKYNLKTEYVPEEIYRVETGVRKSGPWKLDIANLVVGSYLPVFTPVFADLKKRTVVPVRNFEVAEDFTTSGSNKVMKIKKGSLAYAGMHIGDTKKGATVQSIDKSNKDYDVLNLEADFGATVKKGTVIFEASAVAGTKKKNVANFVLYTKIKVEDDGPVLPTLLMQAYEVKIPKLPLPIHELDMEGLTSRFQFEY